MHKSTNIFTEDTGISFEMSRVQFEIKGTQDFMGIKLPIVSGGFGEDKKCISDKTVAEIHNQPVSEIRRRINDNIKRFKEMVDFIDLKQGMGESQTCDLAFKIGYTKSAITQAEHIYLLSERGYAKLIKIMDTDLAWEIHDKIMDEYFQMREEKTGMILPKDFPSALRAYADEYEKNMLLEEKNKNLINENNLLTQQTLEWADRPLINALVRAYGHYLDNDYASAWRDFKKELLYRYGINLNARKTNHLNNGGSKKKGKLDFINDDELPQAISTAVALCREHDVDISDIIQKKAS